MTKTNTMQSVAAELKKRKDICWSMAQVFLSNKDAHGLHDMGVEIQALDRALTELARVKARKVMV
jgi:hypothetical protein